MTSRPAQPQQRDFPVYSYQRVRAVHQRASLSHISRNRAALMRSLRSEAKPPVTKSVSHAFACSYLLAALAQKDCPPSQGCENGRVAKSHFCNLERSERRSLEVVALARARVCRVRACSCTTQGISHSGLNEACLHSVRSAAALGEVALLWLKFVNSTR